MFNVDINKFIIGCIPAPLRKPKKIGWLKVLSFGVSQLYDEFMAARSYDLYDLGHDSRVFSMEAVLNDAFDYEERRIYITDGFNKQRIYIYTPDETKPVYLSAPMYIFNKEDYSDTGVDFIVWIPFAIPITAQIMTRARSLVNKYKLASKRYQIYRTA